MKSATNRVLIVLLDSGTPSIPYIRQWLTKGGYVVWHAQDISHAIEELSDFTVRVRPDVLLLEVAALPSCFETLGTALRFSTEQEVTVVGLGHDGLEPADGQFFARDLDDLKSIIRREEQLPLSCAA